MRPVSLPLVATSLALGASLLAACGPSAGGSSGAACGIAAVAGPSLILSEFTNPGAALTAVPAALPPRLVARFVAGPAREAVVGRRGDSLEVGIEGGLPEGTHPGFGVLLTDRKGTVLGVLVYEGTPMLGAAVLGNVTVGPARAPLIGIMLDPARVQDPRCPFFPDSTLP